jgi:hypothetical protein
VGPALLALCLAAAVAEVLYYVSYNTYFAALGDAEHRGHQVAIGQALPAIAAVVAPLVAAWALITAGPRWTFAGVAAVQVVSVVPLLGLPNVAVARVAAGAWRVARPAALLIAVDGWFDTAFLYLWQITLFVSLGQSFQAYGGAMALAGLVGAAAGLLVGRHLDAGFGRRAALVGYGVAGAVVLLRAASLGSPVLAGIANAMGGLAMPLLVPPLAGAAQNIAKASPCPLRVMMATEGGWDLGCFAACLTAAALLGAGAPLWLGVLLALPAAALGAGLLWRYYGPPRAAPA